MQKSQIISDVCTALLTNGREQAAVIARNEYSLTEARPAKRKRIPPAEMSQPDVSVGMARAKRRYNEITYTRIFVRDGFLDRYSGEQLVFPPVLRLLSQLLPEEFPGYPNYKMKESHIVHWELFPTIDHVVAIANGGEDVEQNWVTTSMLMNMEKSNWSLAELGWELQPLGGSNAWDGLTKWFLRFVEEHPTYLKDCYYSLWRNAATRVFAHRGS